MTENEKAPGATDYKRPSWDEYFIAVCHAIGKRSTCERARKGAAGCVIAKNKQILSTGYVGSPPGTPHCDEEGHEFKKTYHEDGTVTEHCVRTTHAEANAIANAARHGVALEGATVYNFAAPCYNCAKLIAAAGIKRVVVENDYHASEDSKRIFKEAGIELEIVSGKMQTYDRM